MFANNQYRDVIIGVWHSLFTLNGATLDAYVIFIIHNDW